MAEQAVKQCDGDNRIAEDVTHSQPAIGSEDHGVTLVACSDDLKEQIALTGMTGR